MSPNQKIVTRFAPSPTGLLHGGNYRTAVFAYLFAKKMGGEFIVRIEDTDRERSKPEFEANIWETIEWLGLSPDKKYRQSEHVARHTELLKKLIEEGKAYVSKEETKKPGDRAEVIRFKNPGTAVTFVDAIRGSITTDTTDLGDFVIARSETEPVFHFAVVVDDADAGVTHIVRGEDHIPNTPRQILIAQALGFAVPTYAHLPLVLGSDRTKLSKRRGAKALTDYKAEGYLPSALINYLALVGWHPEGEQEVFTVDELTKEFSLERIQKSAGIFDDIKLKWFNHEHLKLLSDADFEKGLNDFFASKSVRTPAYLHAIMPQLRERYATYGEACEAILAGEYAFLDDAPLIISSELLLKGAKAEASVVAGHLAHVIELLQNFSGEFTTEGVKEVIFPYATEVGRGAVLWPMRVSLSGKEKSPDPFTLCGLLGKETTLARLQAARTVLQ